jgi:hypothetical protein
MYARVMGVALIPLGVVGTPGVLGDVVGPVEGILYLGTGGIFLYVGLGRMDARDIRGVVGGMGVLYLATGAFVVFVSTVYELPPLSDYDLWDDYGHIAFGSLSIFVAGFFPCEDDPPTTS